MSDVEESGTGGSISVVAFPILSTIVIHILFIAPNVQYHQPTGFFTWVLYYLTCVIGGFIACSIGNKLRLALMPDSVYTNDGFIGLLKEKIFWSVGPQFIASIIIPFIWYFLRFMRPTYL